MAPNNYTHNPSVSLFARVRKEPREIEYSRHAHHGGRDGVILKT
jgi:hypothetical protein